MKLMLQHRIVALVMIVSGGISTYALPSLAGDFHSQNSYRHSQSQVSFSTDGLPSTLPGGTYVGSISALRVRGNGNYFATGSGISPQIATTGPRLLPAPRAKIITVNTDNADDACVYQHGVCIIRP
ncbi:UNVERIFIED_ORG: hypothetical protein QE446_004480 [Rhizobium sp. SORGH_AS260]|jgi:hypothetical protein|nr:hypothetical protein [Rhizobium sp. RAS22]MDP9756604.1 hypothetical protein [Rhizobium sp. SORGH_AS_0260]MDR6083451.1 hypothetical protein [Agrobacterium sp. SORGH_AS_0440]